jgi:signal transduction histidine kinase
LQAVAERSVLLCRAHGSRVWLPDGDRLRAMTGYQLEDGAEAGRNEVLPLSGGSVVGRAFVERRTVHVEDVAQLIDSDYPDSRDIQSRHGFRTVLAVPMVREGTSVGIIAVLRKHVQPFSNAEIRLVETFADQAVIAIQNARLFHEIEDKGRQLEVANRHKSEFLANMSHELRTPLNAIIGFSEVLTEQMFGDVNDKQMEYLLDIHSSGQHLLTLINDVLDLSKIEAGRMELDLSCFDLGLLLENALTLVRERAQRNGLAISLEVGDGLAEWVADARKVKQVVVNLLSNAVKFTPTGGSVRLAARRVELGGQPAAEVSVADTGVGIALSDQDLVFDEFRQAGGDHLRKAEGTGLGLALAKRFVELHGGTIRVDSRSGEGATFTFLLPLKSLEAI